MSAYRTETCILKNTQNVKAEWCELQLSADYSYFQSWGWIETWLDLIALELQPVVIRTWCGHILVGIGLFVSKDIKRRAIFHARTMHLNEFPFDCSNMITEYNGLLIAKSHEQEVYTEVINHLLRKYKTCDEFYFGAVLEQTASFVMEKIFDEKVNFLINETSVTRSVNLLALQPGIENYLSSLSRNRRGQIRRAIRLYDSENSLRLEQAKNVDEALQFLDGLKLLHTEYWQSKDKGGSFANVLWEKFHRHLIQKNFEAGEIQLLKISCHQGEIAYIYSFILNKHVYVVQTGFVQSKDKRLMPGYVAHAMAITYNCEQGMHTYDLMHGDVLYKRILCNCSSKLQWLVVQRPRLKFAVEKIAVSLVRRFKKTC
ncbi:hypothetical protein MNBD_GAMMA06-581 [hydrothermal vent metagenome]|uniref:BioF2-like acetyltransferase domain-containing protein n=1 Tax=hydrothermal vent metagenome TaxID=652676 RepID=A0A3B0WQ63_9ZZZZ